MKLHWRQYGKYYIRVAIALLMLIGGLAAACVGKNISGQLKEQQLANRWSDTDDFVQLSCFFPTGEGIDVSQIPMLDAMLAQAMQDAAVDTKEDAGRSLVTAYSTQTSLGISSDRGEATVRAYGVSKDYFLFHPLELLSGTYFTSDDVNQDGVILDELVAWQLFGSYEVAGLFVEIDGQPYPVRGVVRSNHGAYSEAAGEETASIYVDYALLADPEYGSPAIDSLEVCIQNPVKSFGADTLKNTLLNSFGMSEEQYEIVDNTHRFSFVNNWKRLGEFGRRSMRISDIHYPAWENRARACEDVRTLLEVIRLLLWIYPLVVLIQAVVFGCRGLGRLFGRLFGKVRAALSDRSKRKRELKKKESPMEK